MVNILFKNYSIKELQEKRIHPISLDFQQVQLMIENDGIDESIIGIVLDETKIGEIGEIDKFLTSYTNTNFNLYLTLKTLEMDQELDVKIISGLDGKVIEQSVDMVGNFIFKLKDAEINENDVDYKALLAKAISIASVAFENEYDKGGKPYILHCLWVMNKVRHLGDIYMIVAVLHDLLEDTEWTSQMLLKVGFTEEIVKYLEILNHDPNEPYMDYIMNKVALYDVTTQVKLRDLEHNSRITRIKDTRPKDLERIGKYQKAYMYLTENKGYK